MENEVIIGFIALISSGLGIIPDDVRFNCSFINNYEQIAKRHCILPILIEGMKNLNCSCYITNYMKEVQSKSIYDYIQKREALIQIKDALNKSNVSYIPLKGSVLCDLYPQPHLRTSSDIDILVREEDIDKAVIAIESNTSFKSREKTYHDIQMFNDKVHLELHFSLLSNLENLDCVLDNPWASSKPIEGSSEWKFNNEYLIFYITAHAAKHFIKGGGVGIRPLLDLWILKNKIDYDNCLVRNLCNEAGILGFYDACCNLTEVWFEGFSHTELTKTFENIVISGGVYGSFHSYVVSNKRNRGKKYIFNRVFLKSKDIKAIYPICMKHPILVPLYQVVRWTHLFSSDKRKAVKIEIEHSESVEQSEVEEYDRLMKLMGL